MEWEPSGGCMATFLFLLAAVALLAVIVLVPQLWGDMFDSRADQLRAEATLERARADREHQQSVDWHRGFELYVITLKVFTNDKTALLVVLSILPGAVVGGVVAMRLYSAKAKRP